MLLIWGCASNNQQSRVVTARMGLCGRLVINAGMGLRRRQHIAMDLCAGARGELGLHGSLPGGAGGGLGIGMELARVDARRGQLALPSAVPSMVIPHTVVTVMLDGKDITAAVTSVAITVDQDALHDQVDLTITDPLLFDVSDPSIKPGELRLLVRFDDVPWQFLIERRELSQNSCTLWGRGPSARLAAPLAEAVALGPYAAAPAASAVATELAGGEVAWELEDWILPASFTYAGDAVEGLRTLAAAAGGVVQALPGGGLRVRPQWPGGLAALQGNDLSAARLDEDGVLACSVSHEMGEPVDSVEISGVTSASAMPSLEVEGTPLPGQDIFVRVFGQLDSGSWDIWTSTGQAHNLGNVREMVTERLAFVAGAAQTSQAVAGGLAWSWVGEDAGDILWLPGSSNLTLADASRHGVADISYEMTFTRFLLRGCDEASVLFVMQSLAPGGVHVIVQSASLAYRARAAEPIEDPLVTSDRVALLRGQAWLLDYAFDRRIISATIPYAPLVPGDVLGLTLPSLHVQGRAWVRAVTHRAELGGRVVTEIDAVQPVVSGG